MATQSIPRLSQLFEEPKDNSIPSDREKPISPPPSTKPKLDVRRATLHLWCLRGSEHRTVFNDVPVFEAGDAAEILGVSQELLEKWRQRGQGPSYYQYEGPRGPVRNPARELRAYQEAHLVRPSRRSRSRRGVE